MIDSPTSSASSVSSPELLLDRYDQAFASVHRLSDSQPTHSQNSTPSSSSWSLRALVDRWHTALAPYSSRILLTVVPLATSQRVGSWPRRASHYAIILAVQPQGWTSLDRRQWMAWWTQWAMTHPQTPDEAWFDFHHRQEFTQWTRIFLMHSSTTSDSGWAWASRSRFPHIAAPIDAVNPQPLVQSVQTIMEQALRSVTTTRPVHLAHRWTRGPWHRAVQEQSATHSFHWDRLWRSSDTWGVFLTSAFLLSRFPHILSFPRNWLFAGAMALLYDRLRLLAWHRWFRHFL